MASLVVDDAAEEGALDDGELRRWPDLGLGHAQRLGDAVDHQPDDEASLADVDADDEELGGARGRGRLQIEALAHVDDRQDRPAQLDHPLDERRRLGHRRHRDRVDDLLDAHDVEGVLAGADAERHQLRHLDARLGPRPGIAEPRLHRLRL